MGKLVFPVGAEAELVRKGNRVCHVRVSVLQEGRLVAEGSGRYLGASPTQKAALKERYGISATDGTPIAGSGGE